MNKKIGKKLRSTLAMLVVVALTIPVFSVPTFSTDTVTPATQKDNVVMSINNDVISLSDARDYEMTISVKDEYIGDVNKDGKFDDVDKTEWYAKQDFELTRDKAYLDEKLFPKWFTGASMTSGWKCWNADPSARAAENENYFTFEKFDASKDMKSENGITKYTVKFASSYLFKNGKDYIRVSDNYSINNAWQSFVGEYYLDMVSGEKTEASAPMWVTPYESYTEYQNINDKLQSMVRTARSNGIYAFYSSYGKSTANYNQYYMVIAKNKDAVEKMEYYTEWAERDPEGLMKAIKSGKVKDYKLPIMLNNQHSDETPGTDAILKFGQSIVENADGKVGNGGIKYSDITGFTPEAPSLVAANPKLDPSRLTQYWSNVYKDYFNGFGSIGAADDPYDTQSQITLDDLDKYYDTKEVVFDVDKTLDDVVYILCPSENPDGKNYNTRSNKNGFDPNRDTCYQTQVETTNIAHLIAQYNPIAFLEFHGFVTGFLVEPCTPPHEPNLEYDVLIKYFAEGAAAYGASAIASNNMLYDDPEYTAYGVGSKDQKDADMYNRFTTYCIPARDFYSEKKYDGWYAWDDLCANYTPSFAMLNCNAFGYTIETPYGNEASTDLFVYGVYGITDLFTAHKQDIYMNQLEFFSRGINNVDSMEVRKFYTDFHDNVLEDPNAWRTKYKENNNFFPEYYVLPIDSKMQRDPADVYEMVDYLIGNGVKVSKLTKNTKIGKTTYKAGSYVVDMHQAKRNYANVCLYKGPDASGYAGLYSESVNCFPELRGFTAKAITKKDAFKGKLKSVKSASEKSQLKGTKGKMVILENNGQEATKAVNAMLKNSKKVGLIKSGTHKGDFLISSTVWNTYSKKYTLVGTVVPKAPKAYLLKLPKVYVPGQHEDFHAGKYTDGYYKTWFSNGYGYYNYDNISWDAQSYNWSKYAFKNTLGFKVVTDPDDANVIAGAKPLSQGMYGQTAVEKVKNGTPYIATGMATFDDIIGELGVEFKYDENGGGESLHYVTYPATSMVTASAKHNKDNIAYTNSGTVFTEIPEGAKILIQVAEKDAHISGCYPNVDVAGFYGQAEAISYAKDGLNLTMFGMSIMNKGHQQDDYQYATAAIFNSLTGKVMKTDTKAKTIKAN